MSQEIAGLAQPRFGAAKDAFAANLAEGLELGARFTLVEAGETVLDLWAGFADRARTRAFDASTLTPVFSVTKAVTALIMARLVDQGRLNYEQPVAAVWPEFGAAGKAAITVGQMLSHQAGLPGFPEPMDPVDWFDWNVITARLAAMAPLWPPGTASGYHPITVGYLAGEVFRRVDGRTVGQALREDIAGPHGLDVWIGLPDSEHARVAEVQRPPALPDFGEINPATTAAFLTKWSSAAGRGQDEWRRMEVPSTSGHATAEALARLMGVMADDGRLGDDQVLRPATVALASAERIRGGDLVLPYEMSWAAGFMRNAPTHPWGPGDATVGHSGWGGACVFADPDRRLSGAYVMNRQSPILMGDPRPCRLIQAAYARL